MTPALKKLSTLFKPHFESLDKLDKETYPPSPALEARIRCPAFLSYADVRKIRTLLKELNDD